MVCSYGLVMFATVIFPSFPAPKIGFIGAYDKTDLIIYIAKILTTLKKKVLVIDATTKQKARYVVPVINPTKKDFL